MKIRDRHLCLTVGLMLAWGCANTPAAADTGYAHTAFAPNHSSPLGMNLSQPDSWTPDPLFVDAMLKARNWIPHACENTEDPGGTNGTTVNTDKEGWITGVVPGTCPGALLLDQILDNSANPAKHYVALGTYVLIWEGEGTLLLNRLPAPHATCKSRSCSADSAGRTLRSVGRGPHKATFELNDADNTLTDLRIVQFSSALPIKRMRVIVPGGNVVDTDGKLDYFSYCASTRGPTDPDQMLATTKLRSGESCRDFADSFWDRYKDSLHSAHKSNRTRFHHEMPKVMFHPLTLQTLKKMRVLRAMDWMHTNNSTVRSPSQLTPYKHENQTESEHGLALDYLVKLANVLNADLWINIPHLADSDYIRALARFIRDNLNPRLKIYVEYSNELWSTANEQGRWLRAQAELKYPDAGDNIYTATIWTQAELATAIADQFDRGYGRRSRRTVHVLGGQAVNTYLEEVLLTRGNAADRFDVYAIAPYFGGDIQSTAQLVETIDSVALPAARNFVVAHKAFLNTLKGHQPRLIAYEGGQHLNAWVDTPAFADANRSSTMQTATLKYLQDMSASGLDEMVYYNHVSNYGPWGFWGARETLLDANAPKWLAIQEFVDTRPCWWLNCQR